MHAVNGNHTPHRMVCVDDMAPHAPPGTQPLASGPHGLRAVLNGAWIPAGCQRQAARPAR